MTESTDSLKSEEQLQEMIAETETGARNPTGTIPKKILFYVPLIYIVSALVRISFTLYFQHFCFKRHGG